MIRVGLGRKKPQRQPSLRRNPSVSQRSPGGTTRLDRPVAASGAETGLPPMSPTSPVIPYPNGAIPAKCVLARLFSTLHECTCLSIVQPLCLTL